MKRSASSQGLLVEPERPGPAVTVSIPAATYDGFIRHGRLLGLSLDEVGELLEAANGGCPGAQPGYRERLANHLTAIEERVEQLLGLKVSVEEILMSDPGSMKGRCGMGLRASGTSVGSQIGSNGEPVR